MNKKQKKTTFRVFCNFEFLIFFNHELWKKGRDGRLARKKEKEKRRSRAEAVGCVLGVKEREKERRSKKKGSEEQSRRKKGTSRPSSSHFFSSRSTALRSLSLSSGQLASAPLLTSIAARGLFYLSPGATRAQSKRSENKKTLSLNSTLRKNERKKKPIAKKKLNASKNLFLGAPKPRHGLVPERDGGRAVLDGRLRRLLLLLLGAHDDDGGRSRQRRRSIAFVFDFEFSQPLQPPSPPPPLDSLLPLRLGLPLRQLLQVSKR